MILEQGTKVLVVHRRLFERDSQRYFIGTVDGYEDGVAKVTGHSWVRDLFHAAPIKKEGRRTKIFAVSSGTLIVYEVPDTVEISNLVFESDEAGDLVLCDGRQFRLDLSEAMHLHADAPKDKKRSR